MLQIISNQVSQIIFHQHSVVLLPESDHGFKLLNDLFSNLQQSKLLTLLLFLHIFLLSERLGQLSVVFSSSSSVLLRRHPQQVPETFCQRVNVFILASGLCCARLLGSLVCMRVCLCVCVCVCACACACLFPFPLDRVSLHSCPVWTCDVIFHRDENDSQTEA